MFASNSTRFTDKQERARVCRLAVAGLALTLLFLRQGQAQPAPALEEGQRLDAAEAFAATMENASDNLLEGMLLIEGDILVSDDFFDESATPRSAAAPNTWPGGVVPYEFDPAVSAENQARMVDAMAEWEAVVDVHFQPRAGEAAHVYVKNSSGNSSSVGRIGARQYINIYNWTSKFIICHELGHCLGMWHEQSRPDRDTYIEIVTANIQPSMAYNFDLRADSTAIGPYDFDSVMHYSRCAFSTCWGCSDACATIRARPGYESQGALMGQRSHLSAGDIAGMQVLYGAPPIPVRPDLVIQELTPFGSHRETGQSNGAWVVVKNQGTAPAGPFSVTFRSWGGSAPCGTASVRDLSGLAAGETATLSFDGVSHASAGTFNFGASADPCDGILELDDDNNSLSVPVVVTAPAPRLADLRVERLTPSRSNPMVGEAIDVEITVANRGDVTAETVLLSLSPDGPSRCSLPGAYLFPLLPGASTTVTIHDFKFSSAGSNRLTAVADSCDQIAEPNELDNTKQMSVNVAAAPCSDRDGDGVCDDVDICPDAYNPDQADNDGNGIGDACQSCDLCGTCVPMMSLATIAGLMGMAGVRRRPISRSGYRRLRSAGLSGSSVL
jgi:hypothetical protein